MIMSLIAVFSVAAVMIVLSFITARLQTVTLKRLEKIATDLQAIQLLMHTLHPAEKSEAVDRLTGQLMGEINQVGAEWEDFCDNIRKKLLYSRLKPFFYYLFTKAFTKKVAALREKIEFWHFAVCVERGVVFEQ